MPSESSSQFIHSTQTKSTSSKPPSANLIFCSADGSIVLYVAVQNQTRGPIGNLALQFNKNAFGLAVGNQQQLTSIADLQPGQSKTALVQVLAGQQNSNEPPSNPLFLDVALKAALGPSQQQSPQSSDIWYFRMVYELSCVLVGDAVTLSSDQFQATWAALGTSSETQKEHVTLLTAGDGVPAQPGAGFTKQIERQLTAHGLLVVVHHVVSAEASLFRIAGCTTNRLAVFCELAVKPGAAKIAIRTEVPPLAPLLEGVLRKVVTGGGPNR